MTTGYVCMSVLVPFFGYYQYGLFRIIIRIYSKLSSMKSVQIRSFFCFEYRKYGPEQTPYLDIFHTVLIDQISDPFNDKSYFLGIFIDLSKAFGTVDHKILLNKLQHYGMKGKNLSWFASYLTGRKQYISFEINYNNAKTELLEIICGVPQGSILGPLLFIIHINDLCQVSVILKPISFVDDTNLFCSGNGIKTLFLNTNLELKKIYEWFRANKSSLNEDKTTFTLFHRIQDRDNLPLRLLVLKINDYDIKISSS